MTAAGPDVSVRVAWADDAPAIAAVQLRAWPDAYDVLDASADEVLTTVTSIWESSLSHSPDARNRVLVSLERNRVTGLAVLGPASDQDCDPVADAELRELAVDPAERGHGHGSRLVQAVADTASADRFGRVVVWVRVDDDALRGFLTAAGWAPDGAHRELEDDRGARLRQVRLHVALT